MYASDDLSLRASILNLLGALRSLLLEEPQTIERAGDDFLTGRRILVYVISEKQCLQNRFHGGNHLLRILT